jgi:hypothetical protein
MEQLHRFRGSYEVVTDPNQRDFTVDEFATLDRNWFVPI